MFDGVAFKRVASLDGCERGGFAVAAFAQPFAGLVAFGERDGGGVDAERGELDFVAVPDGCVPACEFVGGCEVADGGGESFRLAAGVP